MSELAQFDMQSSGTINCNEGMLEGFWTRMKAAGRGMVSTARNDLKLTAFGEEVLTVP
jgi:hypothetical protein